MGYTEWKLTDQEVEQVRLADGDIEIAQEAKKKAYREAGVIILNPDALVDMYEALRDIKLIWTLGNCRLPGNVVNMINKALTKALEVTDAN